MIIIFKKEVLIWVILFATLSLSAESVDIKKNLSFADYLFNEKKYDESATEYLRVLHLYEIDKKDKNYLNYKIGLSLSKANKYRVAGKYFNFCLDNKDDTSMFNKALVNHSYNFFKIGNYLKSNKIIDEYKENDKDKLLNSLQLCNYFFLKDKKHQSLLKQKLNSNIPYIPNVKQRLEKMIKTKYKSPLIGGLMSAIIPGSGRIYAGRFKEGVQSIVSFASITYLAYDGFKKSGIKSLRGWLFSSISTLLYIGNISGSVLAVKIRNRAIDNRFRESIELELNVKIE